MEYREMFSENSQKVNRLIVNLLRMIAYAFLLIIVLSYRKAFKIDHRVLIMDLYGSCVILMIPTVAMAFKHYLKESLKYIIITCSILVCGLVMCHFMKYTFILATLPLVLASLYFDKKLGVYTVVMGGITLVWANMISHVGISQFFSGSVKWSTSLLQETCLKLIQYSLFSMIILYFTQRSNKLFEKAALDAGKLRCNRDGLDVIVDYTDALFCTRNKQEVATIILAIIKNLLHSLDNKPKPIEGYIGIRSSTNEKFFVGINEKVETKLFLIDKQQISLNIEDHCYDIPIKENPESSTVFANKHKLTMYFYSNQELIAFIVLRIHLNQTEEVLNKLLRVLYRNIRLAINNLKLTQDMYETQEELVRAFSEISESKSGQTGHHIKRVSEYMKIMAGAIKLDQEEKDCLVIASMMHDIGKLLIPEQILEKPGKLTVEEFEVIKDHVHLGYKLLEYSPGRIMEIARVIALQHHEKWDGTGYLGMQGEEIDYYSRIMAVVDVFDALMSKRSYKESWTVEEAYNEIVSQSGKHFDPQIVDLFKAHFSEFLEVVNHYPDCEKTA